MRVVLRNLKNRILNPSPKINEVEYKWAQPLNYTLKPDMIVYHHTVDTNLTPEKVDEMHKKRGCTSILYVHIF